MWTKTEDRLPEDDTLVLAAWRAGITKEIYRMMVLRYKDGKWWFGWRKIKWTPRRQKSRPDRSVPNPLPTEWLEIEENE